MTELTPTEDVYTTDQCFITTYPSGGRFYLDNPEWCVPDIAHALAMNCRFNGHCARFYSIAEHSVNVARLMEMLETGDPFEGLMHDVTEAYLSDIPAPFKQKFRELAKFDKEMDAKARVAFGLPASITVECKTADILLCFIESYHLSPHKGEEYADPWNLRSRALEFVSEFEPYNFLPVTAKKTFLAAYKKYSLLNPYAPKL